MVEFFCKVWHALSNNDFVARKWTKFGFVYPPASIHLRVFGNRNRGNSIRFVASVYVKFQECRVLRNTIEVVPPVKNDVCSFPWPLCKGNHSLDVCSHVQSLAWRDHRGVEGTVVMALSFLWLLFFHNFPFCLLRGFCLMTLSKTATLREWRELFIIYIRHFI